MLSQAWETFELLLLVDTKFKWSEFYLVLVRCITKRWFDLLIGITGLDRITLSVCYVPLLCRSVSLLSVNVSLSVLSVRTSLCPYVHLSLRLKSCCPSVSLSVWLLHDERIVTRPGPLVALKIGANGQFEPGTTGTRFTRNYQLFIGKYAPIFHQFQSCTNIHFVCFCLSQDQILPNSAKAQLRLNWAEP